MYGLRRDIDLHFMCEQSLLQLCIGEHDVILNFTGDTSISVQGRFTHSCKDIAVNKEKDLPASASSLITLIGKRIADVSGKPDGTLQLEFSNEHVLTIYDDSKEYESYTITSPWGVVVV